MKLNSIYVLILLMLTTTACDRIDNRLKIKNESLKTIVMVPSLDSIIKSYSHVDYYYLHQVKPQMTESHDCGLDKWDFYILRSYNKKLNLYFFDVDTLKKYSDMDKIVKNKLWIRQMSISKEELEKNNWVVVFKE